MSPAPSSAAAFVPKASASLTRQVIVTTAGKELKKVYYERPPELLRPLQSEVNRLVERVRAESRARVFLRGKPV